MKTLEEGIKLMRHGFLRGVMRANIGAEQEFTNEQIKAMFVPPTDVEIDAVRAEFRELLRQQDEGKN